MTPVVAQNLFRKALGEGRALTGIWSMLNSENVLEGLGWIGFDWILIDTEHSPVSLSDALAHLRTLAGTPAIPIVRIPWNDRVLMKQYLDIGAETIMVPFVQSAEEARRAVRATRYPPEGDRGYAAMHRASKFGNVPGYIHAANDGLFLIVQVETVEALKAVEDIAYVDGVDAVFFGPGDLSASMGLLGKPEHQSVTDTIIEMAAVVRRSGKYCGVLAPNIGLAKFYLHNGFDFVSVSSDCGVLFSGAKKLLADVSSDLKMQSLM